MTIGMNNEWLCIKIFTWLQKEVVDMLPGIQQTSAQAFGTLFLQLTVNDLGICLPITNTAQV